MLSSLKEEDKKALPDSTINTMASKALFQRETAMAQELVLYPQFQIQNFDWNANAGRSPRDTSSILKYPYFCLSDLFTELC